MKRLLIMTAFCAALTGCGGSKPAAQEEQSANALLPGEFEIASEVTQLRPADKSTPATKAKLGDKTVYRGCVAADGTLDPAMFVDAGDECSVTNSYARGGRLSIQYQCSRKGKGLLYPNADGNFTKDGFEALVNVSTSFAGNGDYVLIRHLTAKRVGDCPASPATPS